MGFPSTVGTSRLKSWTLRPIAEQAMRLPVVRLLLSVCALLAVVPAAANAATTPPKVTSVAPLKLKIGDRLTIRGKGFLAGKNRNTVLFKATGSRAVFVKAETATTTKLVVKVPAKLLTFLKVKSGQSVATTFQLRVLAKRLSPAYTPAKGSPTIAPAVTTGAAPAGSGAKVGAAVTSNATSTVATGGATAPAASTTPAVSDCDGDGIADAADPDDDNDLLTDTVERQIGTKVCDADSDGDGMEDGWEYKSALDLEQRSCPTAGDYPVPCAAAMPYPTKRSYPNPLVGDADVDYDGDALTAGLEFKAWKRKATASPAWNNLTNLWYSDGLQASQDTSAAVGCRGMVVPAPFDGDGTRPQFGRGTTPETYPDVTTNVYAIYTLDRVGRHAADGCLDDAERDEDGDFLTNWDETVGSFSPEDRGVAWWKGVYGEPDFKTTFLGTDWLDNDTDGNGVVDGLDDQDHDDFLNVEEITRGNQSRSKENKDTGSRSGLWVQPYNPCLPSPNSRTCPPSLILDQPAWRPFKDPDATDPVPRWPLYGRLLGNGTTDDISDVVYNPKDIDQAAYEAAHALDSTVTPDSFPDITSPEVWAPPVALTQSLPPLHPLPR